MDRRAFLRIAGAGAAVTLSDLPLLARRAAAHKRSDRTIDFKNGTWIGGPIGAGSADEWKAKFGQLRQAGIDAVFLRVDPTSYPAAIAAASEEGVGIHAWMPTMMQGGMIDTHREWYVVNRKGESAATRPAYVDYYHFLCPSRPPVIEHLKKQVTELSRIDGLKSVHLDYIRYPDVILPVSLWEKYGIVQDKEYPSYDYCYCDVCRERFRSLEGVDPLTIAEPAKHERWLRYRYNSITNVVNTLADTAHSNGMLITAAVFPTPHIALQLVRQEWTNWSLDAVMPMIYHSFYDEPVQWIQDATQEGVAALDGRIPLYAGVYVHAMTPDELAESVRLARNGGAAGVVIFDGTTPTTEHWDKFGAAVGSASE